VSQQVRWLDSNLFVHTLFRNDANYARCRAIQQSLQDGDAEGWIDPVVVHELTYVLSRQRQFRTRVAVQEYVRDILLVESIHAEDKDGLLQAITRWARQNVGFVDAWLAVLAQRRGLPVCSVNAVDFAGVPNSYADA